MAIPPTGTSSLRRLRSLCALLVLAVLATSCYSLDSSIVVNEDGSGSFAVEYIIDKDTSEASLIAGDLVNACDAVAVMQNAAPAGSVFTPLDSSSQCGARITMDFANEVEMFEAMQLISSRSRFAGFGHFPDITVNRGTVDGAWNFQAQFKPPLPANLETQADFRSEVGAGTFILRVNLPGRQIEHNADRITTDGTMVFEINPLVDPSGQFFVQTEPGAKIVGVEEGSSLPWTLITFVLLALAALAAGVLIVRRSKKRRQYEGEDDDDAMISASERLGLGASAPAAEMVGPEMDVSDPSVAEMTAHVESVDVAQPELGESLFSDAAAAPQVDSWPGGHQADATSPVFGAEEEPQGPASWVTAAQPIAAEGHEIAAPLQPAGMEPMADWPGSPVQDLAPDPLAPDAFTSDVVDAAPAPSTPAADGWPAGPLVASAAAASATIAAAPAVVDHGTQATQSMQSADAFSAAPQPAAVVQEPSTTALPASQADAFGAAISETPAAPEPTVAAVAATPTQSDMQWDEQRNTYVVYDPRRSSWMAFDDATQSWQQIS